MPGRSALKPRTPEEPPPCLGLSQTGPRKASAPVSSCETHHHESLGEALWITSWTRGLLPRGGTRYGM